MVTLRGDRMWEFFDRLVSVALPRVRDFRGVSPKAFDGRGNYTLGIREQIIFPEVDYDKVEKITGMNVTVCTSARRRRRGQGAARPPRHAVPAVARERGNDHDDRSDRRHADAHPQRGQARHAQLVVPVVEAEARDRARARQRTGFLDGRRRGARKASRCCVSGCATTRTAAAADRRHAPRLAPSRRVYVGDGDPARRNGLGIAVLSTPRGVLSDREAREQNVGGELLCEVW